MITLNTFTEKDPLFNLAGLFLPKPVLLVLRRMNSSLLYLMFFRVISVTIFRTRSFCQSSCAYLPTLKIISSVITFSCSVLFYTCLRIFHFLTFIHKADMSKSVAYERKSGYPSCCCEKVGGSAGRMKREMIIYTGRPRAKNL